MALLQVTRRKGGTNSSPNRNNGYAHPQNKRRLTHSHREQARLPQSTGHSRREMVVYQIAIAGKPAPTVDRAQPQGNGRLSDSDRWQASSYGRSGTAAEIGRLTQRHREQAHSHTQPSSRCFSPVIFTLHAHPTRDAEALAAGIQNFPPAPVVIYCGHAPSTLFSDY